MTFNAILFFLTLSATTAAAQTAPAVTSATHETTTSVHPLTAADTVRALQRLFKSRRNSSGLFLAGTGTAVVASNIVLSNESGTLSSYNTGSDVIVASGIALLYTSPLWVVGISQLARFSKKKEQAIIDEFVVKHTLPGKIQRRLQPSLFTSR